MTTIKVPSKFLRLRLFCRFYLKPSSFSYKTAVLFCLTCINEVLDVTLILISNWAEPCVYDCETLCLVWYSLNRRIDGWMDGWMSHTEWPIHRVQNQFCHLKFALNHCVFICTWSVVGIFVGQWQHLYRTTTTTTMMLQWTGLFVAIPFYSLLWHCEWLMYCGDWLTINIIMNIHMILIK